MKVECDAEGIARLFDPWGSGSLAVFTVTTTMLSIYGFVTGWGLPL